MADRTVVYRLQADVAGFEANMRNAASSTKKLAGDLTSMDKDAQRTRQGLTTLGDSAGKAGLVAAAGLGASIKAAIDWESAFAGVQKTVEGTVPQMAALEDELRNLAKTMPATHQEIAATAEAAGQLGIAREDVAKFTETMLQLGETTNLSAEDAAVQLARFSNIMGTSSDDVGKLGASVVGLGNNFETTEAEVVELSLRMAAAGRQAGLTEADVFGVAAALTSVGVEAEAGGTAFSKVFTSIGDSVRSGGPKLETFAASAGLTADEFARLYENDPTEAIGAFVEGMGDIAREGGNTSAIFKSLGLTDQRLMRAVLSVGSATGSWAEATGLANEEFAKGTALTDEYAKRAETTGAKATVAWNNIRDAAIEVGDVMLPIVAKTAEGVAAMASAFGELPGPVKAAVGPLLGLTAIVGGGTWFTTRAIRSVADTRDALDKLGVSGGKAAKGLKGLSIAGGIAVGIGTLAGAVTELSNSMAEALPSSEKLQGRLIDLAAVGEGFSVTLGPEFDSLGDSVDRLTDPSRLQRLNDWTIGFNDAILPGDQFADGAAREAVQEIQALDAELANLASSGNADVAALALERVLSTLSAEQGSKLLDLLPQYDEALESAANEAKLNAAANEDAANAAGAVGGAMADATGPTKEQAEALKKAREAAADTATSFFNLGDGLNDAEVSLGQWITQLQKQAEALRNFRRNAEEAANKGLRQGLIRALQEAGPEGALRMKQLSNATDAEIRKANRAWQAGQDEINKYVEATTKVPADKSTTVKVQSEDAQRNLAAIRSALDSIKDKTVTIRVTRSGTAANTPGFGPQERAQGGYISGPGTATSDSIPAYLSNGEYVMKAAAVQKYGIKTFDRLNAMRFASGGSVGNKRRRVDIGEVPYEETEAQRRRREQREREREERERNREAQQQQREREAERREKARQEALEHQDRLRMAAIEGQERAANQLIDAAEKQLSAAESVRDGWAQAMERAGSSAVAGFSSSLFSGDQRHGLWSGAGGGLGGSWREALEGDIAGLQERQGLVSQLSGQGLSGAALEALLAQGSNDQIAQLIASGEIQDFARLYAQREALSGSVSGQAGQAAYGAQFAQANAAVIGLQSQVNWLVQQLAAISGQRPINVYEAYSAKATAAEAGRLMAMMGA